MRVVEAMEHHALTHVRHWRLDRARLISIAEAVGLSYGAHAGSPLAAPVAIKRRIMGSRFNPTVIERKEWR